MYCYMRILENKVNGRYVYAGKETDPAGAAQLFSVDMFSRIAKYNHVKRVCFNGYINKNGDHMITVYYSTGYRAKYYFGK